MKEFGSDFHYIGAFNSEYNHLTDIIHDAVLLADGRQCIVALIRCYGWHRIWMPDYFCYEVIDSIRRQTGIEILLYSDNPLCEGDVRSLPYKKGDVLLRMNYFGMRYFRSNLDIPVPVIEDHSHSVYGHWALHSDADWCISSIRKTLPLPEGGIMWSPRKHKLKLNITSSEENEKIAAIRWEGMKIKSRYLNEENVSKEEFREKFLETEGWFETAEPVFLDKGSIAVIMSQLDIILWETSKRKNWILLKEIVHSGQCEIIEAENESCTLFSFLLMLSSRERRDMVRRKLIEASVYPAVLWNVSEEASNRARDFSGRMLSIHCDGRYSEKDIRQLAGILNQVINY